MQNVLIGKVRKSLETEMMIAQQEELSPFIQKTNLEYQTVEQDGEYNEEYNENVDDTHDISFGEDIASSLGDNISIESSVNVVDIEKTETGLGFNIVGGTDNAHFPSDSGIFISQINPQSKSHGLVSKGDKILSVNGVSLINMTHDDAVAQFQKIQKGQSARMVIDREAYLRCLDFTQAASTAETLRSEATDELTYKMLTLAGRRSASRSTSRSESTPQEANLAHKRPSCVASAQAIERLRGKAGTPYGDDEDMQSTTSYAPSMHSIIDDVPRTPRKVHSLLDPRNPSTFTEVLYVTIGLGALTAAGLAAYRFFRAK